MRAERFETVAIESFRLWFDTRFNQLRDGRFRRAVVAALDYRYITIGAILAALLIISRHSGQWPGRFRVLPRIPSPTR